MAGISVLENICPPPERAQVSRTEPWNAIEERLGFTLPDDYKEVSDRYGLGGFKSFVVVFQPNCDLQPSDIESMSEQINGSILHQQEEGTLRAPVAADQLRVAGVTDNGDFIFWVTDGNQPNDWQIAVNEARSHDWFIHDGNLVSFLTSFMDGSLEVPMFPDSLRSKLPHFTPYPSH
jgi:hypothetical protein